VIASGLRLSAKGNSAKISPPSISRWGWFGFELPLKLRDRLFHCCEVLFELFLACVGCVVDALAIAQLRDALFEVVVALYEVLQFLVAGFQFGPVEQFGVVTEQRLQFCGRLIE